LIVCELIDKTGCVPYCKMLPALHAVWFNNESNTKCPVYDKSLTKNLAFKITHGAFVHHFTEEMLFKGNRN